MIRVYSVGVVAADQEAGGQRAAQFLPRLSKSFVDPLQNILKEGGAGPLLCVGSYFLVVKAGVDIHSPVVGTSQEAGEGGVGALQVVQARC